MAQTKKGYIRGVKGAVIELLQANGARVTPTPVRYGIKTTQEIGIELVVVEGDKSDLRGGDQVLCQVADKDIITGATLTLIDARFDAQATKYIAGGTLLYAPALTTVEGEAVGTGDGSLEKFTLAHLPYPAESLVLYVAGVVTTDFVRDGADIYIAATGDITADYTWVSGDNAEIIGWQMPTIAEQGAARTPFILEVYASAYNAAGTIESYIQYTFYYCVGSAPKCGHKDKEWSAPEFTVKCQENGTIPKPVYDKKFVAALPPELS